MKVLAGTIHMTAWDHLCCFGYGVQARLSYFSHLFRGHKVHWRTGGEWWVGCTGDITCDECPDTEDRCGLTIWCRYNRVTGKLAELLCGLLGHPSWQHAQKSKGWDEQKEESILEPDLDSVCCTRCSLWFDKATSAPETSAGL